MIEFITAIIFIAMLVSFVMVVFCICVAFTPSPADEARKVRDAEEKRWRA